MSSWTNPYLQMSKSLHDKLLAKLQAIVGAKYVTDELSRCEAYSADFGVVPRRRPEFVLRPGSTKEISDVVKLANQYLVPVIPRGAGTAQEGGCIPSQGGIVLDLTRLNRILNIDEDTGRVTVEAGIIFSKLIGVLEEKGWKIGIAPSGSLAGTIGGHLSKAGVGWGNILYGTQGDQVIGLKTVLPTGEIIKTGSGALPRGRTITRYVLGPDITGLFIGAEGAMGVVTEITLAIYPLPELVYMARYWLKDIETAMQVFRKISHQRTAVYISLTQSYPDVVFDVVIEGDKDEVDRREEKINSWIKDVGGHKVDYDVPETAYKDRFWEFALAYRRGIAAMICFYAPIEESVEANRTMREIIETYDIRDYGVDMYPTLTLMEHAVGMYFREDDVEEKEKIRKAAEALMKAALERGWAPYTKGRQWAQVLHNVMEHTVYWKTLMSIKKTLDPNNIMNPGVLGLPLAQGYKETGAHVGEKH
ncbi:MAG: FAD-binding oxidoreductase [Candidatus Ranarchaeia archaeon]